MVGKTGFEPATSCSQSRRSTRLSYFPNKKVGLKRIGIKWWLGTGSNRRHGDFQSPALPTELPSHLLARGTCLRGAIYHCPFRIATTKYHFSFSRLHVRHETGKTFSNPPVPFCISADPSGGSLCQQPAQHHRKDQRNPGQGVQHQRRHVFFNLSSTNMKAPAMARP